MAGTFSQIYIQIVFSVKGRELILHSSFRNIVFKYIAGIIKEKQQKPIIINGTSDHVHVFVGIKPSMRISDLTRDIKNNSSKFINENNLMKGKFCWQEGYGAFSYSHSQIDSVYKYIQNQGEHHKTKPFREEYLELLKQFQVQYDEKYLFDVNE
jgi:putative transposase